MLISDISVKRPVFATVINALLVVFGLFAINSITIREYPDIDPPIVSVDTNCPGAAAAIVETRITQLIEDRIAGVEGIRTIESSSRDGRSSIQIEFNLSRDIDAAANDVRDRVSRVLDNLPDEADPPEVEKADADASPIIWMVLSSDRLSPLEMSDYADRYLIDRLGSIDGVSQIRIGGERRRSMRVWLDRKAMAARNLTANDIEDALRAQNLELPAGRLESSDREFSLRTARPFTTPQEFAALVIRRGDDGYPIRLGDVADVEIGAEDQRSEFRANGVPAIGLGVIKQSKANTLSVARAVKAEMATVAADLPDGMRLALNTDYSLFIEASLNAVIHTLVEAGLIVIAVIFLFLGNLRATLIPAVTVPISLIASFILLTTLGFSLNILTMLALVLAIGLVVDDAIVVVENIHRRIELGEPPLLAAYRGTREVGFAVVATTLVLIAVFTPLAFLQGNVGRLFREFSLALAGAVACSSIVALTLAPVMAAALLRPHQRPDRFTGAFLRVLDRVGQHYHRHLGWLLDRAWLGVGVMAVLLGGIVVLFRLIPAEVTPQEDRGQFFVRATAPEGATYDYTSRYMAEIESMLLPKLGKGEVDRMIVRVPGFGSSSVVNTGMVLASTTDWEDRERSTGEIAAEIGQSLRALPGVRANAVQRGSFGQRIGQPVNFVLGGGTYEELAQWRDQLMERIRQENPRITDLDSDYKATKPQIQIDIDLKRAADLGVPVEAIGRTLETMFGSRRVTTFIEQGEEYDVLLQAGIRDRSSPADLQNIYVRSTRSGSLIPLSNLITTREVASAPEYNRVDRLRAITIEGGLAPGYTLSEALDYIERIVGEDLPSSARLSFTGESRELRDSSSALYLSFALALVVVFLVLAAQFESWIHPLVIMMAVPLAVFGALAALAASGYTLNIYSEIGIIMLIGLAAKNGILIVEFANQRRDQGLEFRAALIDAARTRLRPILMTSVATCAGVVPLMLATNAGAEARENLGMVVFWGVLFSTALTLGVVPAFYALLARRTGSPGERATRLDQQQAAVPAQQGDPQE